MHPRPIIFLDMDGVIADFLGGLCKLLGRDLNSLPVGEYALDKLFGMPWAEIDAKIANNYDFWYSIPGYEHSRSVVNLCRDVGELKILSHPWPQSSVCAKAKLDWCNDKFGIPMSEVILTPYKFMLAGPHRILIDDRLDVCEEWVKCGGSATVFPTHHNRDRVRMRGQNHYFHLLASFMILDEENLKAQVHANKISLN